MSALPVKSVAVIGAGAAGAVAAAALRSEDTFPVIRVFERREVPGGTWIYDSNPGSVPKMDPGKLPPIIDRPLEIPENLPQTTPASAQYRYDTTPIYRDLTTNVPDIAMSFSDRRFPYGPFVPHWIPKQYIESYFSWHKTDSYLALNTTVEDLSSIPVGGDRSYSRWKLTLRRFDPVREADVWWEERFDAVVIANGHYSVPFIPAVHGLDEYISTFTDRVSHSKTYRTADTYSNRRVLVIGNSASGHDITSLLVQSGKLKLPVYQSRRSKSRLDGDEPPPGIEWKPVVQEYRASTNEIIFEDDTTLTDIDAVIYCTGYKPSFPFWNARANGGPIYNYEDDRLVGSYQHTFFRSFPRSLGIIGLPRVLTFRSFEYQAVALARLFAGRTAIALPPLSEQERWEEERARRVRREKRKFHDIPLENGEETDYFQFLFRMSGLPTLGGLGRYPPVLGEETRWARKHLRKYPELPEPGKEEGVNLEEEWLLIEHLQ